MKTQQELNNDYDKIMIEFKEPFKDLNHDDFFKRAFNTSKKTIAKI